MKNIIFLLVLTILPGCFAKDPEKTGKEGQELPSFSLLLPDSVTHFTTDNIPKNKPVVLFYFGPRCPYSAAQMEEIIGDIEILKDIHFCLLTPGPFTDMNAFYKHYQLNKYSNITTGIDYANFFGDYFETDVVPYVAIYGKDKRLREAFIGKVYGKQIKKISEK